MSRPGLMDAPLLRTEILADAPLAYWPLIWGRGEKEVGSGHQLDFQSANWGKSRSSFLRREKDWAAYFDGATTGAYSPQKNSGAPFWTIYGDPDYSTGFDMTLEIVFRLDDIVTKQTLFSWKDGDLTRYGYALKVENTTLSFHCGEFEPIFATFGAQKVIYADVEAGKWYHGFIRVGQAGFDVILNGLIVASLAGFRLETAQSFVGFNIGQTQGGGEKFLGAIDTVAVYGSILSAERILAHYRTTGFIPEEHMSNTSRASVLQGIQIAKETIPGFGGAAVLRLKNMEMNPKPRIPVGLVRYPGSKAYTDTQVGQSDAELPFSGAMDFNLIPLFLDTLLGEVTPTDPGSGTAKAREWNPAVADPLAHPSTLVVETGSSKGAERSKYCFATGLTLRWGREEAMMEGTMVGQKVDRNITPTAALPALAPAAIHPKNIGLFLSTNGTNYTKLADVLNGEIPLTGLWAPTFHVDDSNSSFDEIHETMPDFGASITVEEGSEADDFMSSLEDSSLVYLKLQAVGKILEAGTGVVAPTRAPRLTVLSTGGSIGAATHYIRYAYKNGAGETVVSPAAQVTTTGTTNRIGIQIGALPANCTGFYVYVSTDGVSYKRPTTGANVSNSSTTIISSVTQSATSPQGSNTTGTPPIVELMTVELPLLVTQTDPGDKDGVYGNTFTFVIADDETFGLAKINVVNGVADYA